MNLRKQVNSAPGRVKVLFVDDDENILAGFRRNLSKLFEVDTALSGVEGLAAMAAQGPYAVVVADMQMPGMNGVEFLKRADALAPDTVRIMLTGNADMFTAQEAVNHGHIFLFLVKPCSPTDMIEALEAAIRQHELVTADKVLLERTLAGCVQLLTDILGVIDGPSFSRTGPTAELAHRIALDLGAKDAWEVRVAAMLAPIGLVTVPSELMTRFESGEDLKEEERALLAYFPETSAGILGYIPRLEHVSEIVLYQGKNYDGSGFPEDGTAGEALPLGARILHAASAFIALDAAYGSREAAFDEMCQQDGCFDPQVLSALARILSQALPGAASPRRFSELKAMDLLAAPVETQEGEVVAPAGTRLSPALLEKLRHYDMLIGLREPIQVYPAEEA
jgi:response regulator RpfG family c-di-GMP phosphodiesterase